MLRHTPGTVGRVPGWQELWSRVGVRQTPCPWDLQGRAGHSWRAEGGREHQGDQGGRVLGTPAQGLSLCLGGVSVVLSTCWHLGTALSCHLCCVHEANQVSEMQGQVVLRDTGTVGVPRPQRLTWLNCPQPALASPCQAVPGQHPSAQMMPLDPLRLVLLQKLLLHEAMKAFRQHSSHHLTCPSAVRTRSP